MLAYQSIPHDNVQVQEPYSIDRCVLSRHMRRLRDMNSSKLASDYPWLNGTIGKRIIAGLKNPEYVVEGLKGAIEEEVMRFKGSYSGNGLEAKLDDLVSDIPTDRRLGKLLKENERYALALETLKDYDTIFNEFYGDKHKMTPVEEFQAFGKRSVLAQDSPLSQPRYSYERRPLDKFLEEKSLSRSEYASMRRVLRKHAGADLDRMRRLVRGWSFKDMDRLQVKDAYKAWCAWKDSGGTKRSFVENHNISSTYALNRVIYSEEE